MFNTDKPVHVRHELVLGQWQGQFLVYGKEGGADRFYLFKSDTMKSGYVEVQPEDILVAGSEAIFRKFLNPLLAEELRRKTEKPPMEDDKKQAWDFHALEGHLEFGAWAYNGRYVKPAEVLAYLNWAEGAREIGGRLRVLSGDKAGCEMLEHLRNYPGNPKLNPCPKCGGSGKESVPTLTRPCSERCGFGKPEEKAESIKVFLPHCPHCGKHLDTIAGYVNVHEGSILTDTPTPPSEFPKVEMRDGVACWWVDVDLGDGVKRSSGANPNKDEVLLTELRIRKVLGLI